MEGPSLGELCMAQCETDCLISSITKSAASLLSSEPAVTIHSWRSQRAALPSEKCTLFKSPPSAHSSSRSGSPIISVRQGIEICSGFNVIRNPKSPLIVKRVQRCRGAAKTAAPLENTTHTTTSLRRDLRDCPACRSGACYCEFRQTAH